MINEPSTIDEQQDRQTDNRLAYDYSLTTNARAACNKVMSVTRYKPSISLTMRSSHASLIVSEGDKISPPQRLQATANKLTTFGATTRTFVLEGELPHMFMMFERGVKLVTQIICDEGKRRQRGWINIHYFVSIFSTPSQLSASVIPTRLLALPI